MRISRGGVRGARGMGHERVEVKGGLHSDGVFIEWLII
jgi:hypothetical protein